MASSLEIKGITKSFADQKVFSEISFDAEAGEFIVLVGPSGCGKSTILRSIAGLESIDDGDICIDGESVLDCAPKDRDVAMVFQDYALYPHKSVYENIAFGLRIRRIDKATIDRRVRDVAARLDLSELLDRRPQALSGGQRQRVAIGRAIIREPKVFLFDEPLSNLDAKLRSQMRMTIAKLHRDLGRSSVYVTHDQVEAMTLADRIVVLYKGAIQQIGRPLDLYHSPANSFVGTFIGSPTMNMIPGRLIDDKGGLYFTGEGGLRYRLADHGADSPYRPHQGRTVLWGTRPEDLTIEGASASDADLGGSIEFREPLGATTSVHVRNDSYSLHVSLSDGALPDVGSHVQVALADPTRCHLFDSETGRNLLSELS